MIDDRRSDLEEAAVQRLPKLPPRKLVMTRAMPAIKARTFAEMMTKSNRSSRYVVTAPWAIVRLRLRAVKVQRHRSGASADTVMRICAALRSREGVVRRERSGAPLRVRS